MKTILKIAIVAIPFVLMLIADLPMVPEAHAIFGVWRRHARRWAVVGTAAVATTAAVAATSETAAAQQQAAAAQQQVAIAEQQAAAAQRQATAAAPPAGPPASPAAAAAKPLPVGTVVSALPSGCVPTPVGGVEYYLCGGNFYRAVFQGNNLVYVTAQPK